jgi:hemin uptake protein HemP
MDVLGDPEVPGTRPVCSNSAAPCFVWQSADLLQGSKRVQIAHNGACYQLQATRQGKLILTK